jgi:MFS family permease
MAVPVFRALWIAQLISNVGTWMQSVAAQWALVDHSGAALLTALVQAAGLLPVIVLSLPAGVLSDALNRRRYLIVLEAFMTVAAGVLAALQWAHATGPAVLIGVTLALGCASALAAPAWQAIQPEVVTRRLLPSALALNAANVNLARAIGPALAGVLLVWAGPAAVFGINAVSTVFVVLALAIWREPATRTSPVSMGEAVQSGLRYVRSAPVIRRILLRSALFVLPASALWALLAVTSRKLLHQGSAGYGIALAALGVGAVLGAAIGPRLCAKLSLTAVLAGAIGAFAVATFGAGLLRVPALVWTTLAIGGVGWVAVLTVLQTGLQLTLPAWVRARGTSAYILVFMGGQGVGALLWGALANWVPLPVVLCLAGGLLVVGAVTLAWWPLIAGTGRMDRTPAAVSPPHLAILPVSTDGPLRVAIAYKVDRANAAAFEAQATQVALSRRRTGAHRWALWQDLTDPARYVEEFALDTWGEYVDELSERITGFDSQVTAGLARLSEERPETRWYLPAGQADRDPVSTDDDGADSGDGPAGT